MKMQPARQRCFFGATLLAGIALAAGAFGADPPKDPAGKKRPANRLAQESSPYLLQHGHNPVDWYPWGPDAFARAKKEGKLVFLSIGYSSCFWCHVMERESFANEDVAKLLNQWFVCIKVDREERPDIDHIYQTALSIIREGQNGGWPLSMFLTPDAKPIVGGTYWPRDDREIDGEKVRGFKTILKVMHDIHTEKPKAAAAQADHYAEATNDALASMLRLNVLVSLDRELVTSVVTTISDEFDPKFGGFGSKQRKFKGTKFPMPPYLELLLGQAERSKSAELTQMVTLTLDRMAMGGIYDQLGGGFHRYSTERTWSVPHFEKMLYDNAQLAELYAHAYRLTKKPLYKRVLKETLAFVAREMTAPEGGFYSALDAETEGEEGRFYVWTDKELAEVLADPEAVKLIKRVYSLDGKPNFESKYYILLLPQALAETANDMKLTEEQLDAKLTPLRQKLFEARSRRPRPFLDTKVLTAWNGQMIAGYAAAGQALNEPKYLETAGRAADFVLQTLRTKDGRLLRTYGARPGQAASARLNGYLDDYAYLTHGLLCLHDATGQKKWLNEAQALTDTMIKFHSDKDAGGFFYTSNDHEKLFARTKDQYDGAQPAANSVVARNLVRLWQKSGDDRYEALAQKTIKTFAGPLKSNPASLTAMTDALALYLDAQQSAKKKE